MVMLDAGCLIGQDEANQVLQADINADPTSQLAASTLYRDASGWLNRAHLAHSSQPDEVAQIAEEGLRQASPGAQAHDRILEVEDAGLEGGQEGATQDVSKAGTAVKQEGAEGAEQHEAAQQNQAAAASTSKAGNEEDVGPTDRAEADNKASIAIFGEEIATNDSKPAAEDVGQQEGEKAMDTEPPDDSSKLNHAAVLTISAEGEAGSSLGQASDSANPETVIQPRNSDATPGDIQHPHSEPGPASLQAPPVQTFIVLCRRNGLMQIFVLPDMQLLFSYSNVVEGPLLLTQGGQSPVGKAEEDSSQVQLVEACMESFGASYVSGELTPAFAY